MNRPHWDFEPFLTELRRLTDNDFAALAWADRMGEIIYWRSASGNRNDRYKRMVVRIGKGVAGTVLRCGRPIILDSTSRKVQEDPSGNTLLTVEGLLSVICVPVTSNDRVVGVLLTGCRSPQHYSTNMVDLVITWAEQIGAAIQKNYEQQKRTVY